MKNDPRLDALGDTVGSDVCGCSRAHPVMCGCAENCGDDGDVDGPGICKGLPRIPDPPLVEIVMVPR